MKKKTMDAITTILAQIIAAALYAFAWWYAINEFLGFAGKPQVFPWAVGFVFPLTPLLRRISLFLVVIAFVMSYFM